MDRRHISGKPCFRGGAALVVTLSVLVLLTVTVVTFFLIVRSDYRQSVGYNASSETRFHAETALNLVIAQIREASENEGTIWTSQPGALRTFSANGVADQVYKLYSSSTLSENATDYNPSMDSPADWAGFPAKYTDLNQPITSQESGAPDRVVYPIVDPRASGNVDGFAIPPGTSPYRPDQNSDGQAGLALPVEWMYMLEDGSFAAHDQLGGRKPVARIAFWADDETAKLNVNTASEGTYWDAPRMTTLYEVEELGVKQPAQREFQRYPGHPSTTCLSPALRFWMFPGTAWPDLASAEKDQLREKIYEVAPRVRGGAATSKGGTQVPTGAIPYKTDRLYAGLSEVLFSPNAASGQRTANVWTADNTSATDRANIEQSRFFLTAHSRAPDTSLFDLPRISIWPVSKETGVNYRTPFDNLIAFCASVGQGDSGEAYPYYFQRINPLSPTEDYDGIARNQDLYSYLRDLIRRPFPGFGPDTFNDKYPGDGDQILTQIFDYIRCINLADSSPVNPDGSVLTTFKTYTPSNPNQIGKAGMDTTPNFSVVAPIRIEGTMGFGRFLTLTEAGYWLVAMDAEETATVESGTLPNDQLPPRERTYQGLFLTEFSETSPGYFTGAFDINFEVTDLQNLELSVDGGDFEALFPGAPQTGRLYLGRSLATSPLLKSPVEPVFSFKLASIDSDAFAGSTTPPSGVFLDPVPMAGNKIPHTTPMWPPTRPEGRVRSTTGTGIQVTTKIGNQTIQMLNLTFSETSFYLPRPNGWFQTPSTARHSGISFHPRNELAPDHPFSLIRNRLRYDQSEQRFDTSMPDGLPMTDCDLFVGGDVVRTLEPTDGDYRLIAAMQNVPAGAFSPHASHSPPPGKPLAHSLRISTGTVSTPVPWDALEIGGEVGSFNNPTVTASEINAGRPRYWHADFPLRITLNGGADGPRMNNGGLGDWDTGFSYFADGAYINKPDEGSIDPSADPTNRGRWPYFSKMPYYSRAGKTFFSPNRMVPSAVYFGSLPTGVKRSQAAYASGTQAYPWQTLLFNPVPASRYPGTAGSPLPHPGEADPPDHLLLDLFHMPVVEPYAISEPLSTAGRANLNTEIMPFSYVQRDTGLHGVLRSVKVPVVDVAWTDYKSKGIRPEWSSAERPPGSSEFPSSTTYPNNVESPERETRKPIDEAQTISLVRQRFADASRPVYLSASEICTVPLVPQGYTASQLASFWNQHSVTGDNLREQPYAVLYPRLTTRSNTYRVHVRVQKLKKLSTTSTSAWEEDKDVVTSEYRGSFLLERYIDPKNPEIPDYASTPSASSLSRFYRFRVLEADKL